jgi:hypothetical protein
VDLSEDQVGLAGPDQVSGAQAGAQERNAAEDGLARTAIPLASVSKARVHAPAALSPEDLAGPGLTGANWFQGLQRGVDQAFDPNPSPPAASAGGKTAAAVSPLNSGVKANAIPSLPSFWSGLTCCLAVAGAGMIPRVRRAFLR